MIEALQYEFMQNALLAALLASIACGIVGTYVVVKRIVFIAGGISHAAFGGIGLGYWLGINPLWAVTPFSLAAALAIGVMSQTSKAAEDTTIGVFWSLGMALGILFIGFTPGYAPDLFSYLFGNILAVSVSDLYILLALDVVIIGAVWLLHREFQAIAFDEEYAAASGLPVMALYLALLALIAMTVVILIRIVGIILVIALLTIPAAISKQWAESLSKMMWIAPLWAAFFTCSGLVLSYWLDIASGATIILIAGVFYFLSLAFKKVPRRII
jgi:zinc transport system permease protein